ncbi:MAG: thiamine pyrophosphate-dependent enzyme [Coriobacteriia bacterium]|nr:thiamine pyrophosphate-dependent enzyme [Coriobacteriia bacterium]
MTNKLLMGNAAAAHGALAAGVNLISGYPGTPSSELLQVASAYIREAYDSGQLAAEDCPHIEWSANEKVALEVAFGASMGGARALATMKQVGLNVAADCFLSVATLGVKGGLVLYVADDPGPISSQNEQDTRQFAQFAKVPLLDSSTPEDLYHLMPLAFELSERHGTAVIVRTSTRICHGSAEVPALERYVPHPISGFGRLPEYDWVVFPSRAYKSHMEMPAKIAGFLADPEYRALNYVVAVEQGVEQGDGVTVPFSSESDFAASSLGENGTVTPSLCSTESDFAASSLGENGTVTPSLCTTGTVTPSLCSTSVGFVASGISWAYLVDALEELGLTGQFDLLRIGGMWPFMDDIAAEFIETHPHIMVFEDLEPTIAQELQRVAGSRQLMVKVYGKLTGHSAVAGENTVVSTEREILAFLDDLGVAYPAEVLERVAASAPAIAGAPDNSDLLIGRSPVLCAGCPHRASYYAVKKAMRGKKPVYASDIGCYTLGNVPPLNTVDTCVCMGAGLSIPQGLYRADPETPQFGFVGDSTFFASSLNAVVNAVYNQTPVTLVVLDNDVTAMTGSQPHPGCGYRMSYDASPDDALNAVSCAEVFTALGVKHVREVDPFDLPAAIAAVEELAGLDEVNALVFKSPCINIFEPKSAPSVAYDSCTGCGVCIKSIGCPALTLDEKAGCISVNKVLCYGCDLCVQICPLNSLVSTHD